MAIIVLHSEVEIQDMVDLMITALEGGINYWIEGTKVLKRAGKKEDFKNVKRASEVIAHGGELSVKVLDDEPETLTREKFLKGLETVMLEDGNATVSELVDNHDADTVDRIIQHALFGEIVFG